VVNLGLFPGPWEDDPKYTRKSRLQQPATATA
jgi:hypothetical protein